MRSIPDRVIVISYEEPSCDRVSLKDVTYLEELDKRFKYTFWFDGSCGWMVDKRETEDEE